MASEEVAGSRSGFAPPCEVCSSPFTRDEPFVKFCELLPLNFHNHICEFTPQEDGFRAKIHLSAQTEQQMKEWLDEFQERSLTTLRLKRTYPNCGTKLVFKADYRCHHNTRSRSESADQRRSSKNTKCPAILNVSIKRTEITKDNGTKKRTSRSKDPHMPKLPALVYIDFCHNHLLVAADVLKHRDVGEDVKLKLLEMFKNGHSPSSALQLLKYDLQIKHGSDFVFASGDRRLCPDPMYCYRLYYKTFKTEYGEPHGEALVSQVASQIEEMTAKGAYQAKMLVEKGQIIIAIVTPLMRRVHELVKHSGELVFMDASGTMDRHNCRIFLIMTHSCAGGLPLGCLITTNESEDTIKVALQAYNSLLDHKSYGGRGVRGPQAFITDDSAAERQALHTVYPDAVLILCVFHVLQAFWRYLWDSHHHVKKEDRPHIFHLLKVMVYAKSVEELEKSYDTAVNDNVVKRYTGVQAHMNKIFDAKESWAVCYRRDLLIRGNDTNNFCEAAMRVLKDKIFMRMKAFNLAQLLDFLTTRLEQYYEQRLLDIANNRLDRVLTSRYLPGNTNINPDMIKQMDQHQYVVPSEAGNDKEYQVDMSVGLCTCEVGATGGPCKHQFAVMKKYRLDSWNFVPVSSHTMRRQLYHIAVGPNNVPENWFSSLRPVEGSTQVCDAGHVPEPQQPEEVLRSSDHSPQIMNSIELEENTEDTEAELAAVFEKLRHRLRSDPTVFNKAMQAFIGQVNGLKTDSALVSALHCFGRYTGAAASISSRKSQPLMSLKRIGVQPTAVARRKMAVGGRKRMALGRPCKSTEPARKKSILSSQTLPSRRRAPHDMAKCVMANRQLGKTHSTK